MFNIKKEEIGNIVGLRTNGNVASTKNYNQGYEALGTLGDKCVIYSNTLNTIVELTPKESVEPTKLAMVIGINAILQITGYDRDMFKLACADFGMALITECQIKGTIADIQTRGRGFWATDDGTILVNSTKLTDLQGNEFSRRQGNYVYKSAGDLGYYNDTVQSTDVDGKALFDMFYSFNFKYKTSSSYKMLGFMASALLPGVLPWRVSTMAKGGTGTGKSTLSKTLQALLGDKRSSRYTASSTTVAGVISNLEDNAVATMLDEMEAADSTSRLLTYNRNVSEGITGVKGSASGKSVKFNGRTCFFFGGINPPKMEDADSNRLIFVEMEALRSGEHRQKHFLLYDEFNVDSKKLLNRLGQGVCMRVLNRASELITSAYKIKDAMYSMGYSDRVCDTYAPAISGAWIILNNGVMTEQDIVTMISNFDIPKEVESVSMAQNIYNNLFNTIIKADTTNTTLNFLIRDYVESIINMDAVKKDMSTNQLSLYGIRVEFIKDSKKLENSELSISVKNRNNDGLTRILGQEFKNVDLDNVLMQIKGASRLDKTVRIGGLATRAVNIKLNINDFYMEEKEYITAVDKILDVAMQAKNAILNGRGADLAF